jgi:hypothetical protein
MNYSARTNLAAAATYSATGSGTYWAMMTQTDQAGQPFSYLASEARFAVLKDLESRNLIVPVVGNFSGPKALRAVGAYVKDHGATVSAFYLSNVESYLQRDGSWPSFCANVATFPLDDASVFIRPSAIRRAGSPPLTSAVVNGQPIQFVVFTPQSGGSFTTPVPPPGANVVYLPAPATGRADSAALVPPKSPPAPISTTSNEQMLQSGLIPIKGEVQACRGGGW